MEGLGVAASSIALWQAIEKIAKLTKRMKNAQQRWDQYYQELKTLHTIVCAIEMLCTKMQGPVPLTINIDGQEVTIIQYCFENINICILDATNFLDKYNWRKTALKDVRRFFRIWKRARWVYKEDDIQDLFDRVVYARSCLELVQSLIADQHQSHEHAITQQMLRSHNDEMASKLQALHNHYENNIQKFQSASIEIRECVDMMKQPPLRAADLPATPAHEGYSTLELSVNTRSGDIPDEGTVSAHSHDGSTLLTNYLLDADIEGRGANNEGQYGTTSTALIPFNNPASPYLSSKDLLLPTAKAVSACDIRILFLDGSCSTIPAGLRFIPDEDPENHRSRATSVLLGEIESEGTMNGSSNKEMALVTTSQQDRSLSSARQFKSFFCRQAGRRWERPPSELSDGNLSSSDDSIEGAFERDISSLEFHDGGSNQKLLQDRDSGQHSISIENDATMIEDGSDESAESEEAAGKDESSSGNEEDGSDVSDENDQSEETYAYREASATTFRTGSLPNDDISISSSIRDTDTESDVPFYPKRERVNRTSHITPETVHLSARVFFHKAENGHPDEPAELARIRLAHYDTTALPFCIRWFTTRGQCLGLSNPCNNRCSHGRIMIFDEDLHSRDLSHFNWVNIVEIGYGGGLKSFVHPERGATIPVFKACGTGCTHTRVSRDGPMCSSYFLVSGWPMRGGKDNNGAGSCCVQ